MCLQSALFLPFPAFAKCSGRQAHRCCAFHVAALLWHHHRLCCELLSTLSSSLPPAAHLSSAASRLRGSSLWLSSPSVRFQRAGVLYAKACLLPPPPTDAAPLFVIALIILITTSIKTQKQTSEAYSKAGAVASEAFSAIRTVAAYGGERHELARYAKHVLDAARFGVRRGIGIGFSVGVMVASFYLECACAPGSELRVSERALTSPRCRRHLTVRRSPLHRRVS